MKSRMYELLVNRVPGIRDRYRLKKSQNGSGPWAAGIYLLWLNVQYYLLFQKKLGQPVRAPLDTEKELYWAGSESSLSQRESPEALADRLAAYDVISFDVFDTLIFRPFSSPADLFALVGMELDYLGFQQLRVDAEQQARRRRQKQSGHGEVTLSEIWHVMERETGIDWELGMRTERLWERRCCFANPYMQRVVEHLRQRGKEMVVTSDMYLSRDDIRGLLEHCGYAPFRQYFVSSEYGESKHSGGLYRILQNWLDGRTCIHVGDHAVSDQQQARNHSLAAHWYPNVQKAGAPYRAEDLSLITGSIYRSIVNTSLHNGLHVYSREYEYGFVYGGLFVTGFCRFIHESANARDMDKILFLSRDGAVLYRAYRKLYPDEAQRLDYVYWSRLAAVKLAARYGKADYFRRFLHHKADQGNSLEQILQSMEITDLLPALCKDLGMHRETLLTYKNVEQVQKYLMDVWPQVVSHYDDQVSAGREYYAKRLQGCTRAAAVDIGWAGTGPVLLDCVVNRVWGLSCPITGILAGTSTGDGPDGALPEPYLFSGRLVSYLYSQGQNRDLWKLHDPAQGHNLYWELLLGAAEGSFQGFYPGSDGGCECRFKQPRADPARIREIHRGILDFVTRFQETEERLGRIIPISGRDAYAPMLLAESPKNKAFLRGLEDLLDEINIG